VGCPGAIVFKGKIIIKVSGRLKNTFFKAFLIASVDQTGQIHYFLLVSAFIFFNVITIVVQNINDLIGVFFTIGIELLVNMRPNSSLAS